MSLGTYRPVARLQPGWLVFADGEWVEIRSIFTFTSGWRVIQFTDGSRGELSPETVDVRVITNAEKRQRREALEVTS